MKFIRTIALVFVLILPMESKAEFFPAFSESRDSINSEKFLSLFEYFIPLPFKLQLEVVQICFL